MEKVADSGVAQAHRLQRQAVNTPALRRAFPCRSVKLWHVAIEKLPRDLPLGQSFLDRVENVEEQDQPRTLERSREVGSGCAGAVRQARSRVEPDRHPRVDRQQEDERLSAIVCPQHQTVPTAPIVGDEVLLVRRPPARGNGAKVVDGEGWFW